MYNLYVYVYIIDELLTLYYFNSIFHTNIHTMYNMCRYTKKHITWLDFEKALDNLRSFDILLITGYYNK